MAELLSEEALLRRSKPQLVEMCRARGLSATGPKRTLADRILAHGADSDSDSDSSSAPPPKRARTAARAAPDADAWEYGSYEAEALDAWDGAYAPGDARSWEADLGDARSCALCGGKKDFEFKPRPLKGKVLPPRNVACPFCVAPAPRAPVYVKPEPGAPVDDSADTVELVDVHDLKAAEVHYLVSLGFALPRVADAIRLASTTHGSEIADDGSGWAQYVIAAQRSLDEAHVNAEEQLDLNQAAVESEVVAVEEKAKRLNDNKEAVQGGNLEPLFNIENGELISKVWEKVPGTFDSWIFGDDDAANAHRRRFLELATLKDSACKWYKADARKWFARYLAESLETVRARGDVAALDEWVQETTDTLMDALYGFPVNGNAGGTPDLFRDAAVAPALDPELEVVTTESQNVGDIVELE